MTSNVCHSSPSSHTSHFPHTGSSYIFMLLWQCSLLMFLCQGGTKWFCRAHSFLLENSAFGKACDVLVASNPRDENELSLLRGSLIEFLHLFKLGYHPLGRFPAYSTRAKAISVVAISNFLLQGIWMQFPVYMFIYQCEVMQTSKYANRLGGTVLVAI